ncbi:hypothetical protein ACWEIJ_20795 [Lentzea sp. NPDC004789]
MNSSKGVSSVLTARERRAPVQLREPRRVECLVATAELDEAGTGVRERRGRAGRVGPMCVVDADEPLVDRPPAGRADEPQYRAAVQLT